MACIFCKIINKEVPAKLIKETDSTIVIEDINPKAPVHYLVIPKKHVANLNGITSEDKDLIWDMYKVISELGNNLEGVKAFNTLSNNGREAGQSVDHMHVHFVAGRDILKGAF